LETVSSSTCKSIHRRYNQSRST